MSIAQRIESDGFVLVSDGVSPQSLRRAIDALNAVGSTNGRAGRRNVAEEIPEVRELAGAAALHALAREVLGSSLFVVRVLLFDKTPSANWAVGWHQDTAIAVRERAEAPGSLAGQ